MHLHFIATALLAAGLAGCATPENVYRPNRTLAADRGFDIACDGDYDKAPKLASGKSPVFPIRMLSPDVVEDRKVRRLPMEWPVTTQFDVDAEGRTANVRSTATSPQSFSDHMTVAVRGWRFDAAQAAGNAVTSQCKVTFTYRLQG